jgi:hypothetical protein
MDGDKSVEARDLPPDVVDLLELAAERVDLGVGDARLEAVYKDGVLRYTYLHVGAIDRHELRRRFPPPAD